MDDSLSRPLNERVVRVDGRDGTNTLVRDGCVGVGVCECEGKGQYNYEEYMRECLYVPYPRENTPILNKRPSPLLLRSSCTRVF